MAKTAVQNSQVITLQPTGVASNTALNPIFVACDPTNGNFFTASGRDLVVFFCLPAVDAPAWSATATYTVGQVVTSGGIQYIALANAGTNLNQTPATSPTFWAVYTSSSVTLFSAPDACTGRKSDIVGYPVPVPGALPIPVPNNGSTVRFQILPSSVFTQTDGSVQFTASSNLVQVSVSSL